MRISSVNVFLIHLGVKYKNRNVFPWPSVTDVCCGSAELRVGVEISQWEEVSRYRRSRKMSSDTSIA